MKPFVSFTSFGTNVAPTPTIASSTSTYAIPIAGPRFSRPRFWIHATSGSSATARKSAMMIHVITPRAIQITSSTTATARMIKRTRRIVRGRNSTTRSGGIARWSPHSRTLLGSRAVTLRSTPVVEHASLPGGGGGAVEVWVGVPEDPYIKQSELTTVDLQLREGANVLASVSTVLDPDQTSEALALAREVR